MKVLIDGDSLVYTVGFASQTNIWQVYDVDEPELIHYEHESKPQCLAFIEDQEGALGVLDIGRRIEVSPKEHAFHSLKVMLQKIAARAKANSYKIYLTGGGNFRESVATIMGYKHNRKDAEKPVLYQEIRDYLVNIHKATIVEGMEADDALSIVYQRSISGEPVNVSADPNHPVYRHPDECIIAAIDKDLRNIPGKHINFDKRVAENDEYKYIVIDEEEGRRSFWRQVLTGDSSDNILGIPGMGPKKADAILDGVTSKSEEDYFWAVYGAYKKHYGIEPFEYLHYSAYTDTTATFRKREAKPDSEILPEQRLTGTALIMLLENARLLWMLREAPNAEGTHWWMPPMSFEDIELFDQNEQWLAKDAEEKADAPPEDAEPFKPWTEGRGKWFWTPDGVQRFGKFGTEKKAKADIAEWKLSQQPVDEETAAAIDASVAEGTQTGDEDTQSGLPAQEEVVNPGAAVGGQEEIESYVGIEPQPDSQPANVDPVCQKWGFWDETWATWYGPYDSEEAARAACDLYAAQLNGTAVEVTGELKDSLEEELGADVGGTALTPEPEVVGTDDLVTEPIDNSSEETSNNAPVLTETATETPIWDSSF
jgi:DNA polymerase-1